MLCHERSRVIFFLCKRKTAYEMRIGDWSSDVFSSDLSVDNTYPGPNDGFEGYDESAARGQFLYEGDAFEALLNLHRRNMNGTARPFRANIIEPGSKTGSAACTERA